MTDKIAVPGQGRIYKRGKKWYIDYWSGGQRVRESAGGNMGGALKLLAEKSGDPSGIRASKRIVPFSEFADEYIEIKSTGARPRRSIRSIRGYVAHLKAFFGDLPLAKITSDRVKEYQKKRAEDDVVTTRKKPAKEGEAAPPRKMSGPSINREVATLRNIFSEAQKRKLFRGDNPVVGVEFYPEQPRDHKILESEEFSRLVKAADPNLRPIIMTAVQTGLRKNDILGLKWKDLDSSRNILTAFVSKTQERKAFRVGNELVAALRALPRKSEFIFTNPETGTHWKDIDKWWEKAKAAAGLGDEDFVFHDLRANAGVRVEEVAGAYAAQMLLGHKNLKTTEIYLNLTPERAQAAARVLADFFKVEPEGGTNVAQAPPRAHSSSAVSTH
jgi:integrase